MYKLTVCAVVKNEAPYLEEWLCYHILIGVEHFFIYDNGSIDGTQEILKKYKALGFVTWEEMLDIPIQFKAYKKCIDDQKENAEWCAFIDVDEFIVSRVPVAQFLKKFPASTSVLAIHWMLYGSSFQAIKKDGLVIERFKLRSEKPNKHVKSIVRLEDAFETNKNSHTFLVKGNIVNEIGESLPKQYAVLPNPTAHFIWLNHYHTKSYHEYIQRKLDYPTSADGVSRTRQEISQMFTAHDLNEVEDTLILPMAPKIKEAIEARM